MRNPLPIIEAPRTDGPDPETGIFGVGAAATTQRQLVCDVQEELRHSPPMQTNPPAQSVLSVQVALQPDGGIGVGVGVLYTTRH